MTPALFVSHEVALQPGGGGVQRCTREYLATIRAAGFAPEILSFAVDRSWATRIRRRIRRRPHADFLPPGLAARCLAAARDCGARVIFLNHSETGPLAQELRRDGGERLRLVMLSHGLDSTDCLHEADISGELQRAPAAAAAALGRLLFTEMAERSAFDVVFCLSEVDVQIERWLGTARAVWLPRVVTPLELAWQPVRSRIGTVSTLDHPPNLEGLRRWLTALDPAADVHVRLVGGPASLGRALATEHQRVEYLGPLDDAALAVEAETWAVFVNPIFRYARGCSTKVAQALSWRLPIATTRAGARGYWWDEAIVPLADDAGQLARLATDLAVAPGDATRRTVRAIADRSPTLTHVADLMRATIATLP